MCSFSCCLDLLNLRIFEESNGSDHLKQLGLGGHIGHMLLDPLFMSQ